jgi:hypothetical protein
MTDRERYERSAAPEAIAASIENNIELLHRLSNELLWISGLQRIRLRQVRSGECPPNVTNCNLATPCLVGACNLDSPCLNAS